jgi:hypothetical protein
MNGQLLEQGAAMGDVPSGVFFLLGWGSIGVGVLAVVIGTALLLIAAWRAWKVPASATPTDAIDLGKVLDAISKLPQWAITMIVGYLQILFGFWMLGATLFGKKLLP